MASAEQSGGTVGIWPLFYFEPEWVEHQYRLEPWVSVQRATDVSRQALLAATEQWCDTRNDMRGESGDEARDAEYFESLQEFWAGQGLCPFWYGTGLETADWELEWFLVVNTGGGEQQRPADETGVDFAKAFRDHVGETFLTALEIAYAAPVRAALTFEAPVLDGRPDWQGLHLLRGLELLHQVTPHQARAAPGFPHGPELDLLAGAWAGLARLWRLEEFNAEIQKEVFHERLDRASFALARSGGVAELRDMYHDVLQLDLPLDKVMDIAKAAFRRYGPDSGLGCPPQSPEEESRRYRQVFGLLFGEARDSYMDDRSRIGRAVMFYRAGLQAADHLRFVSMWLVLESLFARADAPPQDYVAQRVANFLDSLWPQLAQLAHDLRKLRNDILHGRRSFSRIVREDPKCVRSVTVMAAFCLLRILVDDECLKAFASGNDDDCAPYLLDLGGS